jgi:hypothetical protein
MTDDFPKPLDFSLTTKGIEVTGGTSLASDLQAFIDRLQQIAELMQKEGFGK